MKYRDYIIRDPKILDGAPIIKGTQIKLNVVLGHLALGDTLENILKTYPELTPHSVRAVIAFAASLAQLDLDKSTPLEDLLNEELTYQAVAEFLRSQIKKDPENIIWKNKLEKLENFIKTQSIFKKNRISLVHNEEPFKSDGVSKD